MLVNKNEHPYISNSQLILYSILIMCCLLILPKSIFADFKIAGENNRHNIQRVLSYETNSNGVKFKCIGKNVRDTVSVNISFPFIDAIKVELNLESSRVQKVISNKYNIAERSDFISISTGSISVQVCKDPWAIKYFRGDQQVINQNSEIDYHNVIPNIVTTSLMLPNEYFYGFGEKFNGLNQRGNKVVMELNDAYKSEDESAYKSIPFFLSSRKYGVLVNSPKRVVFNMGNSSESEYDFIIPDSSAEYYIFLNEDPLKIISQYSEITGKPPLIPKWALEPWLSRRSMTGWNSPSSAESDIDMLINRGFRLGVVLWEGIRRMFNEPHAAGMTKLSDKWHRMGIKQICWGYTGHLDKSKVEQSVIDKGYFIRYSDGSLCQGGYSGTNYYIDPTNDNAMKWFLNKYYYKRFIGNKNSSDKDAWNLDGIKIDFSELFPKNDSNLLNIDKSIGMHNQHSVLFSEMVYNWLQRIKPEGGITWVRGGGLGLQKVGFTWGGDRGRTFKQLRGTVAASLGISACGISLIGHDLGGYRGGDALNERKVYIRGVQYATYSPSFHDHGSAPGPWEQNEYGIENYSFYSRVRYNILPYLYHFVKVSHDTGVPIMRTLYMHHPDDENTFKIDDEYYFGTDILVAPILNESNERKIYLPEGNWINFWDQKKYCGKQNILYETPLNKIPVFVRESAIIPLELNNNLEIGGIFPHEQKNNLLLSFRLFAGQNSKFEYFHKDTITIAKQVSDEGVIVSVDNINGSFAIIADGMPANNIIVNGKVSNNIGKKDFAAVENGWRYDDLSNQLLIKIADSLSSTNFIIEIEEMEYQRDFDKKIFATSFDPPNIIKAVGWNRSAVIDFSSVREAEYYNVKYWEGLNNDSTNILNTAESPILIPNLENGIEYSYSISSVIGKDTSNESIVKTVKPYKRKPFFIPNDGSVFINSAHYLSHTLHEDSRKYIYGLILPSVDRYTVWLKMKKGYSHFQYFRWYKIGTVNFSTGENYFELELLDKDVVPGMIYLSADGKDRPIMKDEIEGKFEEREINITDIRSLKF